MKILIVDSSTEGQTRYAEKINSLSDGDLETYDIEIMLASDKEYEERLTDTDVLILGSGLGEAASSIAVKSQSVAPWVQIIMYVSGTAYSAGAFRMAHSLGARKVISDAASPMDLLQELVSIRVDHCRQGRTQEAKIVVVTSAKGGTGVTSVASALGEIASANDRRVLLWDLDVETRDLCRALSVWGDNAVKVSSWVNGSSELTRSSLRDTVVPLSPSADILVPPHGMAESLDLICHTDGVAIVERVLELARVMYDTIIIDSGGIAGPAVGALMRLADTLLLVVGDSSLSVSGVDAYLGYLTKNITGSRRIKFLCSRTGYSIRDIRTELDPQNIFGEEAWDLPSLPRDVAATKWPGSGKTFYSLAERGTRSALEQISEKLGLIESTSQPMRENGPFREFFSRIFERGALRTASKFGHAGKFESGDPSLNQRMAGMRSGPSSQTEAADSSIHMQPGLGASRGAERNGDNGSNSAKRGSKILRLSLLTGSDSEEQIRDIAGALGEGRGGERSSVAGRGGRPGKVNARAGGTS